MSLPTQNLSPSFCHHTLGRRKLLIHPISIFSKFCFCFPQRQKEVEETVICFIKIQSKSLKMRPDLKICWFVFTQVSFFEYTRPVGKKNYHFEIVKTALILIYNIFVTKNLWLNFFMNEHQEKFWPARFL